MEPNFVDINNLLSISEACQAFNVSLNTVYRWHYNNGLKFIHIGGIKFVDKDALKMFIPTVPRPGNPGFRNLAYQRAQTKSKVERRKRLMEKQAGGH